MKDIKRFVSFVCRWAKTFSKRKETILCKAMKVAQSAFCTSGGEAPFELINLTKYACAKNLIF